MNGWSNGRKRKVPLLRLLGTLLALGLVLYVMYRQGWAEIAAAVQQISVWPFLAAFGLTLASRLCVSGRWHVLLRSAGMQVSAGQSIRLTFAGLFASNFLPTTVGGDVVRLGGALRFNLDQPTLIASLVVDRLVGMAGMAMAIPFGLPALLKSSLLTLSVSPAAPALLPVYFAPLSLLKTPRARRVWEKGENAVRRMFQALALWIGRPRWLLASLGFSFGHMFFLFSSLWLLLRGMGEPVSFWMIAGLWSLSYFVTLLPVSINGLGVQELSLTLLFTTVGGVSEPGALTLAFLIRILQMFASLPGAFFIPSVVVGQEAPS
jgi:glycosyltransferase 2 family protein